MANRRKATSLTPMPGSRKALEIMAINQIADRHFACNKDVFRAAIETIITKLYIDGVINIVDFGTLSVIHLEEPMRRGPSEYKLTVVFTPAERLLKDLGDVHVKF